MHKKMNIMHILGSEAKVFQNLDENLLAWAVDAQGTGGACRGGKIRRALVKLGEFKARAFHYAYRARKQLFYSRELNRNHKGILKAFKA